LIAHGLASELYDSTKVDGAPTAYNMEYLDLSIDAADLVPGQLQKAFQNIVTTLEYKKYPWRSSN